MTPTSTKWIIVLLLALVAAGGTAFYFAFERSQRGQPSIARSEPAAPARLASAAPDQATAALASVQAQAGAIATALGGASPSADATDGSPSFDIARIEPSGDTVVAGRALPGATVELLRNGEVHDQVVADASGQFAMVPPVLPPGTYQLTLRAKLPNGTVATSKQTVAVALEANAKERPVVALMAPGKPTRVMSQPAAPKAAAGPVVVEVVEIEAGGKFHVSGRARPGAAMRFYLNDSLIASVTAAADGRFAITINEGVTPGNYRVRLDEVEPKTGAVQARAEVPFTAPNVTVTASVTTRPADSGRPSDAMAPASPQAAATTAAPAAAKQQVAVATSATQPATQQPVAATAKAADGKPVSDAKAAEAKAPSVTVVPKVVTATVISGDSLWRISQTSYGAGMRYAVIWKANQNQIRDPDLIYPGQVFVLPAE